MDPHAFRGDLELVPAQLGELADRIERGLDGLDEAVRRAAGCRRILVVGIGSSRYGADAVALRLRAGGVDVASVSASTRLLPAPSEDLVVVAVSATGRSAEVLTALESYRGTGRLIAVTNDPASPLAAHADTTVPLHAGIERSGIACRTFRATFPVLETLLNAIAGVRASVFTPAALRRAADATTALSATAQQWLPGLSDLLAGPDGAWVLAPVERLSSAQQSALMMREVPRRPAFASETGEWAHVDVYLTKTQDYRAVLFAGSPWDGQAVEWMRARGSRYATVGHVIDDAVRAGAELAIRFPDDDDDAVRMLTEPLVGELVAADWLDRWGSP